MPGMKWVIVGCLLDHLEFLILNELTNNFAADGAGTKKSA
jgi:hypothetical protein